VILEEGQIVSKPCIYSIVDGAVVVKKISMSANSDGNDVTIANLGLEDVFGEINWLLGGAVNVTVIALTRVTLSKLDGGLLTKVLHSRLDYGAKFYKYFVHGLSKRLQTYVIKTRSRSIGGGNSEISTIDSNK